MSALGENEVGVSKLPECDFCRLEDFANTAEYDFKTKLGPWANGCRGHYFEHRMSRRLGVGRGQKLILVRSTR